MLSDIEKLIEKGIGGDLNTPRQEQYLQKLERQLALEEEMHVDGKIRYQSENAKAIEKGREGVTKYGRYLLKSHIDPLSKAIKEEVEKKTVGRGVTAHKYINLAKDVGKETYDVVAYLTLKSVLDSITLSQTLQKAANRIASTIEDEVRIRSFELEIKPLYDTLKRNLEKSTSYTHKRVVMNHCMTKAGLTWEPWGIVDKLHLGTYLIRLCQNTTGLCAIVTKKLGKNNTPIYVEATPNTIKWIESKNKVEEVLTPKFYPTIIPPRDWINPYKGGYHNELLKPLTMLKTNNQNHVSELANRKEEMLPLYDAINSLQKTAWRINKPVLQVLETIWERGLEIGKLPPPENKPLPPMPYSSDDRKEMNAWIKENKEQWTNWKHKASKIHEFNNRILSKRLQVTKIIQLAKKFQDEESIYFPHQLDFRGRAYPVPMFLNPQGVEFSRALLEFSEGKKMGLNPQSGRWLAIHVANQYGMDKLSLDQRELWTKENAGKIYACAKEPLDNIDFWGAADKPLSFLATAFEWAGYMDKGKDHITHIPISLDGSCNGLQIFSLLLKDEIGGHATNLLPSDKPQDIYGIVAERTENYLRQETSEDLLHRTRCPITKKQCAELWLKLGINRKLTKRPVMVVPYSGTMYACREYIEDYLTELKDSGQQLPFDEDNLFFPTNYLAQKVWDAINKTVVKAREAMDWLQHISRLAASENLPVNWQTPTGFWVNQQYKEAKSRRVYTRLGDSLIKLSIAQEQKNLNKRRQASGISPNFIHSLDAAAMMLTVNKCKLQGINSFGMIHDSYATHAVDVEQMALSLREVFVEMFSEDILYKFYEDIYAGLSVENQAKVRPLPAKGNLDINQVLKSKYFFA
jgi:DNA-directed RNA polymerase